ncbi:hypothetical protein HGA88_05180 [Candidatus Roizmanbacteria bacterium]|nr:hypothetical protein [Candidatus Roizmanbacteria bacterium]
MENKKNKAIVGVFHQNNKVYLLHSSSKHNLSVSNDGLSFKGTVENFELNDKQNNFIQLESCSDFRIASQEDSLSLLYKKTEKTQSFLHVALSLNGRVWKEVAKLSGIQEVGVLVPDFKHKGNHILYFGERVIQVAQSPDLHEWEVNAQSVLAPHKHIGTDIKTLLGIAQVIPEGILILYFQTYLDQQDYQHVVIHGALFDKHKPDHLLWHSQHPLWEGPDEWRMKQVNPVSLVELNGSYISYWDIGGEGLLAITHTLFRHIVKKGKKAFPSFLSRVAENPILSPIAAHWWESKAVFNPTAFVEDGKVHLIYRAIGDDDISTLGYATSEDGINFTYRGKEPIYVPRESFEGRSPVNKECSLAFMSGGGGNGGCEDPRITRIDDMLYMTYVAYDGWSAPRVALTSISVEDFKNQRWDCWAKPVLISAPGVVNKNACILPKKVKGKYAIFHRIYPHILIDYVDDLNFDGKTKWLEKKHHIPPRRSFWDSRKVGVGPTPILTDEGWLMIYQSVGDQDPGRYKIGAMVLDKDNPEKVLYRCNRPILEPEAHYENQGMKWGVVYPCGTVIFKGQLIVYYGGADMVVCAASAPYQEFMDQLKHSEVPHLHPVEVAQMAN